MMLNISILIFSCSFAVLVISFIVRQIMVEKEKRAPKDVKAEFMSDLFRLQIKWSKKGYQDFALGVAAVIDGFNLPPDEPEAVTEYGRMIKRSIKDAELADNE